MLHCTRTFVLLFRCRECSDKFGQRIPFTGVIVTLLYTWNTYTPKVYISTIVTVDQSLSILQKFKMILGASILFRVYLPASSQTLKHCA